jgi:hypothetical protein
MEPLFRVIGIDEYGYSEVESDGYETFEEAQTEADAMSNTFEDVDFYVEQYEYEEPKERVYAYPNSVDGWEDIYPLEDY